MNVTPPKPLLDAIPELHERFEQMESAAPAERPADASKGGSESSPHCATVRANRTTQSGALAEVAEWQTQRTQNPPSERA